jgi:F-type H+-transporting ATPase subunit gamma
MSWWRLEDEEGPSAIAGRPPSLCHACSGRSPPEWTVPNTRSAAGGQDPRHPPAHHDKGLCGPLNANLFKLVMDIKTPAKFVVVGRKGAQFLARSRRDVIADFGVHDRVPFAELKVIGEFMIKLFLEGTIDTIEVIYPRFRNTLVQDPVLRPVLPLANLKEFQDKLRETGGDNGALPEDTRDMIFEPSPQAVLEALLPFYVNRYLHQLALSAKASEHSARMVAMKTAKDNASKLLDDLTLDYNKARQAAITQEILEIAAGQATAA